MKTSCATCPTLETTVERMKLEIINDVKSGKIPATVKSFSELHDHVDANEYGGMCEEGMPERFENADSWIAHAEQAQTQVDAWLRADAHVDVDHWFGSAA